MARFTETDEAAQLLQQILAMSTAAAPESGRTPDLPAATNVFMHSEDETVEMQSLSGTLPAPPRRSDQAPAASIIQEIVTTSVGQVQLTLRAAAQDLPDDTTGSEETVADFFRRVVRPFPDANLSAV